MVQKMEVKHIDSLERLIIQPGYGYCSAGY